MDSTNERKLLAKLENIQRERERERQHWEQQMLAMQAEVG